MNNETGISLRRTKHERIEHDDINDDVNQLNQSTQFIDCHWKTSPDVQ